MLCKLKYIDVKESVTLMMMKQTRRVAELSPIGQAEVRGQQGRVSMVCRLIELSKGLCEVSQRFKSPAWASLNIASKVPLTGLAHLSSGWGLQLDRDLGQII